VAGDLLDGEVVVAAGEQRDAAQAERLAAEEGRQGVLQRREGGDRRAGGRLQEELRVVGHLEGFVVGEAQRLGGRRGDDQRALGRELRVVQRAVVHPR